MNPEQCCSFPLIGGGGEIVDFARTITGHGVTSLPPMVVDEGARSLTITLRLPGRSPRTVTIESPDSISAVVRCHGPLPDEAEKQSIAAATRHVLRLDPDLTPFYSIALSDPQLTWVARGAGRMTRCQTVFEDIVKTILTTNCTWSATIRMTNALVQHLGEAAPGAEMDQWTNRAFPTPEAMANADEAFYRGVVKCGYRAGYLRTLAKSIVDGDVEVESLAFVGPAELPDDEMAKRLISLPGVGPYAAAHIMMMLGRYSKLILDSWTRPTYARKIGVETISDAEIIGRFQGYGDYAGLAFWLTLTEDWLPLQ